MLFNVNRSRREVIAHKNNPCAYCGLKESTRTKGHVIPDSMYPSGTNIQRLTVPECEDCKDSWKDADDRFRILICMCTETPETVFQFRRCVIDAIHNHKDVPRLQWIVDHTTETTLNGKDVMRVHPDWSPDVIQVLQRITRGLLYKTKYPIEVHKTQVTVRLCDQQLPDFIEEQLDARLEKRFFRFGIFPLPPDSEDSCVVLVEFYEKIRFGCFVRQVHD